MEGWIKLHRKTLECVTVTKDAPTFCIWIYLLLKATHSEYKVVFGGEKISLMPGQLITGRKQISMFFKIDESKVRRVLKKLENDQQIVIKSTNQASLITIVNWALYQDTITEVTNERPTESQTSDQQVTTNKNIKNVINKNNKKDIMSDSVQMIINYLNEKAGRNFRNTSKNAGYIKARLKEGFTEDDFKAVIDKKVDEWLPNDKMQQYLRPETLFGTKFESYLNQKGVKHGAGTGSNFDAGRHKENDSQKTGRESLYEPAFDLWELTQQQNGTKPQE